MNVSEILDVLNSDSLRETRVCFGRVNKTKQRFYGTYKYTSYAESKRRGGGFVLWIDYKGTVRDHRCSARAMLNDYQQSYRKVKTKVVNPSVDLLYYINGKWVKFGHIFPFRIRELKCTNEEIRKWADVWRTILFWPNQIELVMPQNLNAFTRSICHN
jgi:hypothetical protein